MVELLSVVVWFLGGAVHTDKVALRKSLVPTKAVQSGGYQRNVAQFKPCVMPNPCSKIPVVQPVVQFTPCVMPNPCAKTLVAQVRPCAWPSTCNIMN